MRFQPVFPHAHVNNKWHIQWECSFHEFLYHLSKCPRFIVVRIEHEFIMHLEEQSASDAITLDAFMDMHHGLIFSDVRADLARCIFDRRSLSLRTNGVVATGDIGQVPSVPRSVSSHIHSFGRSR